MIKTEDECRLIEEEIGQHFQARTQTRINIRYLQLAVDLYTDFIRKNEVAVELWRTNNSGCSSDVV